jgi:two-component system LytT family sensor kinase
MASATVYPLFGKLYRDTDAQFLLLQIIGWFSLSLISFFSLTLWYNQQSANYIGHTLLQSAMGIIVSWPLRSVFHHLWNKTLMWRLALTLLAVLACSVIWSVLRIGTFMWMTDETDVWSDFGGWLFGSIMIFLCWAAFYHGIKYYQLLQAEHEDLLKIAAENQQEQLKRMQAEAFAKEAQLKMLRYQLNPHFLFNTLNAISSLVEGKSSKMANTMIVQLSSFLRYSLESDPVQSVTLKEEIEALRLYLSIEQTRFGDRLALEFNIDSETQAARIPSLLLQPLVENAIKYAVAPKESGGTISVTASLENDEVVLVVSDNGPGIRLDRGDTLPGAGIGLKNTRDRLRAFYGDAYTFDLLNGETGGLAVSIRLPMAVCFAQDVNMAPRQVPHRLVTLD